MPRRSIAPLAVLAGAATGLVALVTVIGAQEIDGVPRLKGGEWTRIANLKDNQGRFQSRQEHSAVALNGFVYLIGGFVPTQPPPTPTEANPEPFPFNGTAEVLAYVPADQPGATFVPLGKEVAQVASFRSLGSGSNFPEPSKHHIVSVAHQGRIWSLGGHAGPFTPTDTVYQFMPNSPSAPEGTWSGVNPGDASPCDPASGTCLKLPEPRAAGAAVSVGSRIYLLGGVVPYAGTRDPANESIRTSDSVLSLDTTSFPLTWQTEPPMFDSREHFNAVVAGGRIWAFLGRGERSTHMRGVESWAPGEPDWRREPDAPIGASANVLAAVGDCVYSFGGEFIASNVTGTMIESQVFHVPSRTWREVDATFSTTPLDAATPAVGPAPVPISRHGTYGIAFVENGKTRIMAPGGAITAWFNPISQVHVFTPPSNCAS